MFAAGGYKTCFAALFGAAIFGVIAGVLWTESGLKAIWRFIPQICRYGFAKLAPVMMLENVIVEKPVRKEINRHSGVYLIDDLTWNFSVLAGR